MPRERDQESGKYTTSTSDEEFLDAIREEGGLAGTGDIADVVGCSRRHALNRLHELEEAGLVTSKDVGRSYAWILAEDDD